MQRRVGTEEPIFTTMLTRVFSARIAVVADAIRPVFPTNAVAEQRATALLVARIIVRLVTGSIAEFLRDLSPDLLLCMRIFFAVAAGPFAGANNDELRTLYFPCVFYPIATGINSLMRYQA
jgi:hypothetical protein